MMSFFKKAIGVLLFVGGTWLLWWNEGISATVAGAIGEARAVTVELADLTKTDPSFDGKMVHATGFADTKDTITDPLTGASVTAISLARKVQYYQMTESKHTERRRSGNKEEEVTTYTYKEAWSDRPIDSSYFYYKQYNVNVVLMEIPNEVYYAPNVTFGAYRLAPSIKASIPGLTSVDIATNPEILAKLEAQITPPSVLAAGRSHVHVRANVVQLGKTPNSPEIGDIRVTYSVVKPSNISVLAQITKDTLEPFKAANGSEFSRISIGNVGMDEMYGDAESKNTTNMWTRRVMGVLFAAFGLKMLMSVKLGGKKAFLLGFAWSLLVIVVALMAASL